MSSNSSDEKGQMRAATGSPRRRGAKQAPTDPVPASAASGAQVKAPRKKRARSLRAKIEPYVDPRTIKARLGRSDREVEKAKVALKAAEELVRETERLQRVAYGLPEEGLPCSRTGHTSHELTKANETNKTKTDHKKKAACDSINEILDTCQPPNVLSEKLPTIPDSADSRAPRLPGQSIEADTPNEADFESDPFRLPNFAKNILKLDPYPWQLKVMQDVDVMGSQVAAKCANGSGKTSILSAAAAMHGVMCYQGSGVITTAGVYRQVKEQMWPRIREMSSRFKGFPIETHQTEMVVKHGKEEDTWSKALGFSTDDPGKFEGFHPTGGLLVILDEAKSIPDEIFEAVERCKQGQPTRLLMLSSPGGTKGMFYEAFHKHRHLWKTHTVTAYDCPHIPEAHISALIAKYGEKHPLIRSMVFGEFMDVDGEQLVLNREDVKRAVAARPVWRKGSKSAFCDFAAGGDENSFCHRNGNKIVSTSYWVERNTMAAVGRFLQLFRRYDLQPGEVWGDAGGLGIPICDALAEAGFPLNRVNNGSPAIQPKLYANRGAEIWYTGARLIEQCDILDIPDDDILIEQLCTRRSRSDAKGRLALEKKEEMRARGLGSPDRADALMGCVGISIGDGDGLAQFARPSMLEMLEEQHEIEQAEGTGFFAGI